MGMILCRKKPPHCLLNQLTYITNKILVIKYTFMLFPWYDYLYNKVPLFLSKDDTSSSRVHNVKNLS